MSRYSAQFQFLSLSWFCYVLLCNLQFVYGLGNGNIHDYKISDIIKPRETEKLKLDTITEPVI